MKVNELFEARDPKLTYTNKAVKGVVDRVIVKLEGIESGRMTKFVKQYKAMQTRLERVSAVKEELNKRIKDEVLELFDAEDEIYTRVVETVSLTATVSKQQKDGSKVDYEAVVSKLLEMTPELTEQLDALVKEFTTAVKAKAPGLTVKLPESKLDESAIDVLKALQKAFKAFLKNITSWGKSYDKKLASIKKSLSVGLNEDAENKWLASVTKVDRNAEIFISHAKWVKAAKSFGKITFKILGKINTIQAIVGEEQTRGKSASIGEWNTDENAGFIMSDAKARADRYNQYAK